MLDPVLHAARKVVERAIKMVVIRFLKRMSPGKRKLIRPSSTTFSPYACRYLLQTLDGLGLRTEETALPGFEIMADPRYRVAMADL